MNPSTSRLSAGFFMFLLAMLAGWFVTVSGAMASSDDFNDNVLSAQWSTILTGSGPSAVERNGRLEITIPENASSTGDLFQAGIISRCRLTGDFDIQVDYELLTWPAHNGVRIGLGALDQVVERVSGSTLEGPGQELYHVDFYGGVYGETDTADTSGRLRLVRSGNVLTGYYDNAGAWVALHSYTYPSGVPAMPFAIRAWSHDSRFIDQEVMVAFDNFVMNGEVACNATGQVEVTPVETIDLSGGICGTETVINNGPGDQFDPHVSGDLVSYTSALGIDSEIRYYDFRTNSDQAIDREGGYDFLSDINGQMIVFNRIVAGGSRIYAFDAASGGTATEIDSIPGAARRDAAIGSTTIAWEDLGITAGSTEIMVHDMSSMTTTRLTNDQSFDDRPAVAPNGNVVVWRKRITGLSKGDISVAVRSNGTWTISQLTNTAEPDENVDTNGSVVVYDRGLEPSPSIFWQPVGGGIERHLALPGRYHSANPNISENFILFEWVEAGAMSADILLYDIDANILYRITNTTWYNERLNDLWVGPDGLIRVVWSVLQDSTSGENVFARTFRMPNADAGSDQTVHAGSIVTLDGSQSSDPDEGYPLTYSWAITRKPAGSSAALINPDTASPSFTADVQGDYEVELVVSDACGLKSSPDKVLVSTANTPPVADAGADQSVIVLGSIVTLDGSQSWDDDGDSLSYSWTLTQRPAGSTAALSDPAAINPTFRADVQGVYQLQLVVNDGWTDSRPDTVDVSFQNIKPVSNAGGNQAVTVGDSVVLDGTGSSDANGDPLTHAWSFVSRPAGSTAVIANETSAVADFIADAAGSYVVSLTVNDGFIDSDPSNATITATAVQAQCEDVIIKLKEIINGISNLDAASFKNANMRNTLTNKINAVIGMIQEGNYSDAIDKLENDIGAKMDGCAAGGYPDKNDWIKDCTSQALIYQLVQEAIDLIRGSC